MDIGLLYFARIAWLKQGNAGKRKMPSKLGTSAQEMRCNMRLIDANAFIKKMKSTSRYLDVKFDIDEMPTIDAVPVVRCKDCANDGLFTCPMCYIESQKLIFINHDPEFFCGFGERKEGAD